MPVPIPPQVRQWEAEAREIESKRIAEEEHAAFKAFLKDTNPTHFFDLTSGQSGYCVPWALYFSEGYYFLKNNQKLSKSGGGTYTVKVTRVLNRLAVSVPADKTYHVNSVPWTSIKEGYVKLHAGDIEKMEF